MAADIVTEAELRAWLEHQVAQAREVDFSTLLAARASKSEQCGLFSALLQGCKSGDWTAEQADAFGPVLVKANPTQPRET